MILTMLPLSRSLIALLATLWPLPQIPTSDPRPTTADAPQVSFLEGPCRLESTSGAHWQRLWLNCGSGPHLISEPSSFMWHVGIEKPEQALELVRLFSSLETCERLPTARWLEVSAAPKGDWLRLDDRTFRKVCSVADAREVVEAGAKWKLFAVKRCLLNVEDGHLYFLEEHVRENGETTVIEKRRVLSNAARRIGDCDPPGAPTPSH